MTEPRILCKYDQLVDIDSLIPYALNRNQHTPEQIERLALLLAEHGIRAPVVVATAPFNCIAKGHGTVQAYRRNGWTKVAVVFQDFRDADELYTYCQSDNAIASWAGLDLKQVNLDIQSLGPFNIDLLGIKDFVVDVSEKKTGADDIPKPPAEARTKTGELWALGPHRLLIGDSTLLEDVERVMAGDQADIVFTDPPYGVQYRMNWQQRADGKTILNDDLNEDDMRAFLVKAMQAFPLKAGGSFYLCAPPGRTETVFRLSLGDAGLRLRQCLVWVKQQFVFGRQDYHWRHESLLYGWAEGAGHYFVDDHTQDTVWEIDRPHASPDHPTTKPVELVEKALRNSSRPNDVVFDGFGGSGTTLIAADRLSRRARLIELDPVYADVVLQRYSEYGGQDPVREDGTAFSQLRAPEPVPAP